jgi:hypothetical protein
MGLFEVLNSTIWLVLMVLERDVTKLDYIEQVPDEIATFQSASVEGALLCRC